MKLTPKSRTSFINRLVLGAVVLGLNSHVSRGDITVDPDGVGANDVVVNPQGDPSIPLTNPQPDSLDLGDDEIGIGYQADGTLAVTNGSHLESGPAYIGSGAGTTGIMILDGPGTTWEMDVDRWSIGLLVGVEGRGELHVTNGAVVTGAQVLVVGYGEGADGVVNVSGAGSRLVAEWDEDLNSSDTVYTWLGGTLFGINPDSNGTVNVTDGGHLITTSVCNGSSGTVNVYGAGSLWTVNGGLFFHDGQSTLNITSGGRVVSEYSRGTGDAANPIVRVDGVGSLLFCRTLMIGATAHSDFSIWNGGRISSGDGSVGETSNTSGMLTVDGPGSGWSNSGDVVIGGEGNGTIAIQNGGIVTNAAGIVGESSTGAGVVTVDGIGSGWFNSGQLEIGGAGAGRLDVNNSGRVENSKGVVGAALDGHGDVSVSGIGATWVNNGPLHVGDVGNGELNIENGGVVYSSFQIEDGVFNRKSGVIGSSAGATGSVVVNGIGSTWYCSDELYVGDEGVGMLHVINGGIVNSDSGVVGEAEGSSGNVVVDGEGSTWNNNRGLIIGRYGNGSLSIKHGADVSAGRRTFIGYPSSTNSTGIVSVHGSGSRLSVDSQLDIGPSSSLIVSDGALVSANSIRFHSVDGGSSLVFGIGPNGPGFLELGSGISFLHQTLGLTIEDGVMLANGDEFTVLVSSREISGTFDYEDLQTFANGYRIEWAVHYNPFDVTLEVLSSVIAGDLDEDGDVDGDDFLIWQSGFGIDATGDADNDGDTDGDDFLVWQSQFGMAVGHAAGNAAVPEPAGALIVTLMLCVGIMVRRRN